MKIEQYSITFPDHLTYDATRLISQQLHLPFDEKRLTTAIRHVPYGKESIYLTHHPQTDSFFLLVNCIKAHDLHVLTVRCPEEQGMHVCKTLMYWDRYIREEEQQPREPFFQLENEYDTKKDEIKLLCQKLDVNIRDLWTTIQVTKD